MKDVQLKDKDGYGLPGVIFQGNTPYVNTDFDGRAKLPAGEYRARVVGYPEKNFTVDAGQNKPIDVIMESDGVTLSTVEITASKPKKKNDNNIILFIIIIIIIYILK